VVGTASRLLRQEGLFHGLIQPGMLATCSRELVYSSLRFSIYPTLRRTFQSKSGCCDSFSALSFLHKFGAGLVAGAIGSSIANPADLLKIRMQAQAGRIDARGCFVNGPRAGQPAPFRSTFDALGRAIRERSLYRGVSATCLRSSLLTAGQLASYDHGKQYLKRDFGFQEGPALHVICSIFSGFVAATCAAPADRIKTSMMLDSRFSLREAALLLYKEEGARAFFRGWLPSYLRLAPHFIIVSLVEFGMALLSFFFC
jgi:hypothetical protein